ncbi:transcriptional regulator [Rubellimicrobium rubrum]|uniref:Transcriptional regulator n=1 Tax=Rubellimicrobium rubrum TaxID=2585369 RepID=A0A5C4N5C2_9RHOB|nr:autoinducer binding domain-containing protein [Rubellimicrobium rubrum]TNC52828.1 transcriptional regulator [Rubellimicrobium rubrum]
MNTSIDIPAELAELKIIAPAGFAVALHVHFTTPAYLFQTYPTKWIEEYGRDGLVMQDPVVAWSFANTGTIAWKALAPSDRAGVLARAAAHGLNHGIGVSLIERDSRSVAFFARTDRAFSPDEVARIEAGVATLHDATDPDQPLGPEAREGLRRLSVAFTHP